MQLKTYRARTIHEALALVRRDLGPDAAVLGTREVRAGGSMLAWLRRDRLIEVTASTEVAVPSRLPTDRLPAVGMVRPRFTNVGGIDLAAPESAGALAGAAATFDARAEVDSEVERRPRRFASSPAQALPWLLDNLLDVGTPRELALELLEQAMRSLNSGGEENSKAARTHLIAAIAREIAVAGPISAIPAQRRLVALVGPTGVGKTTTTAKMAAHYRLHAHRSVGLITVDAYRIAAVEQLRTYAGIIDVPLETAATPDEIRQALDRLADVDLILMDTAGCSPRDEAQIEQLESLLDDVRPDEVHLVLSCVSGPAALAASTERFSAAGANRLILTKLDEAHCLGALLPLLRGQRLPLSYVTGGQNVPNDMEVADPVRVAQQILGSREPATA